MIVLYIFLFLSLFLSHSFLVASLCKELVFFGEMVAFVPVFCVRLFFPLFIIVIIYGGKMNTIESSYKELFKVTQHSRRNEWSDVFGDDNAALVLINNYFDAFFSRILLTCRMRWMLDIGTACTFWWWSNSISFNFFSVVPKRAMKRNSNQ